MLEGRVPLDGEEGGERGGQRAREHAAQGHAVIAQRDGHIEGRPLRQIRIAGHIPPTNHNHLRSSEQQQNHTLGGGGWGGHLMAKS